MTYQMLQPMHVDAYRTMRVFEVTLDGTETNPARIAHHLGQKPLLVWGQMQSCTSPLRVQPMWYVSANEINIEIRTGLGTTFLPSVFMVFCWTPIAQNILVP